MSKILEDMWYGNLNHEGYAPCDNKEIKELVAIKKLNRERLLKALSEDDKQHLERYDECINEIFADMECELFMYAFKLGGRFVAEILGH